MKPIEIFKPGKHTAMTGEVIDFTAADLAATARAYNPALWEAPLVVGHPKLNAPAYGWAKSLAYSETLNAAPYQIDLAFAEMVNAGRFKKVSASFFLPNSPDNPVPGVYYLRHIGFLGAQAPAVKGLRPASFAEAAAGVISFGDVVDGNSLMQLLRAIREMVIAKFDIDTADRTLPTYLIDAVTPAAADNPSYDTPNQEIPMLTAEQIKVLQDENSALKSAAIDNATLATEFAAREGKIKAQEALAKRTGLTAFADSLVKAGKLLPRDQAPLVEFMAALDTTTVIEFADGAARHKKPGADWLQEFLGRLPKQVEYAALANPDNTASAVAFAAPPGYSVDASRAELHNKALAFQTTHPNTSYDAALAAVSGR